MSILKEAQDYRQMFGDLLAYGEKVAAEKMAKLEMSRGQPSKGDSNVIIDDAFIENARQTVHEIFIDEVKQKVAEEVRWAKQFLKRNDRIVWYLRFVKANLYATMTGFDSKARHEFVMSLPFMKKWVASNPEGFQDTLLSHEYFNGREINTVKSTLGHALSMEIREIQNLVFLWQSPWELRAQLNKIENEWRETLKSRIDDDGQSKIVMDFKDGFMWVDLDKGVCRREGDAMGHCGNAGNPQSGETILSLRKRDTVEGKTYWTPFLTFILDSKGYLGEMKGRGNQKPADRYHKYIVPLLKSDLIKGMKGGGYMPENNFALADLPDAEFRALAEEKPTLLTIGDRLRIHGPRSIVDELNSQLDRPSSADSDGFKFSALDDNLWLSVGRYTKLYSAAMDSREINGNFFGIATQGNLIERSLKDRPESLVNDILYEHRFYDIGNLIYELTGEDTDEEMFRVLLPKNVWNRVIRHMMSYKFMKMALNDAHQYYNFSEEESLFPEDLTISYEAYITTAGYANKKTPPTRKDMHVSLNDFRKFVVNVINAGQYAFYGSYLTEFMNERLNPDDTNSSLALMIYEGNNAGDIMSLSEQGLEVRIDPDQATGLFSSGNFIASLNDTWSDIGFERGWGWDNIDKDVTDDMYRLLKKVDEQGKPLSDDEGYQVDYTGLGDTIIKIFDLVVNSPSTMMRDILQLHGDK